MLSGLGGEWSLCTRCRKGRGKDVAPSECFVLSRLRWGDRGQEPPRPGSGLAGQSPFEGSLSGKGVKTKPLVFRLVTFSVTLRDMDLLHR